ncbi:hypothetical protein GDO86_006964 [Hymenochirus boettgeri]|uniref:Telomerase RNA component interacting RNase n=1 Tax=Hymenochirus boettgeri TaxID=247094 RepID=A0A8T2JDP2_9PIPI|nr:hypothetical protein GDO86_006964 [Hymenochirus boettgeri]
MAETRREVDEGEDEEEGEEAAEAPVPPVKPLVENKKPVERKFPVTVKSVRAVSPLLPTPPLRPGPLVRSFPVFSMGLYTGASSYYGASKLTPPGCTAEPPAPAPAPAPLPATAPDPAPPASASTSGMNLFANDGSFLELFKKKMETETSTEKPEEPQGTEEKSGDVEKRRPISLVGKRRGGAKLALKTGIVAKKPKTEEEEVMSHKGGAWAQYMAEVKKYKAHQCSDDDKTRPLVK